MSSCEALAFIATRYFKASKNCRDMRILGTKNTIKDAKTMSKEIFFFLLSRRSSAGNDHKQLLATY